MTAQPGPGSYPITLYRGDSRVWRDEFTSARSGKPLDLTGYSFEAQIRDKSGGALLASMDIDTSDVAQGVITRTLSAQQTRDITASRATWDLQLTSPTGFVRTYVAGPVRIRGDVSTDGTV